MPPRSEPPPPAAANTSIRCRLTYAPSKLADVTSNEFDPLDAGDVDEYTSTDVSNPFPPRCVRPVPAVSVGPTPEQTAMSEPAVIVIENAATPFGLGVGKMREAVSPAEGVV
jgi:hypothetical protein